MIIIMDTLNKIKELKEKLAEVKQMEKELAKEKEIKRTLVSELEKHIRGKIESLQQQIKKEKEENAEIKKILADLVEEESKQMREERLIEEFLEQEPKDRYPEESLKEDKSDSEVDTILEEVEVPPVKEPKEDSKKKPVDSKVKEFNDFLKANGTTIKYPTNGKLTKNLSNVVYGIAKRKGTVEWLYQNYKDILASEVVNEIKALSSANASETASLNPVDDLKNIIAEKDDKKFYEVLAKCTFNTRVASDKEMECIIASIDKIDNYKDRDVILQRLKTKPFEPKFESDKWRDVHDQMFDMNWFNMILEPIGVTHPGEGVLTIKARKKIEKFISTWDTSDPDYYWNISELSEYDKVLPAHLTQKLKRIASENPKLPPTNNKPKLTMKELIKKAEAEAEAKRKG